ncbi:intradiol ring-cleavage dioxygenase [Streptomyces sp. CRN 30]|uniref:intradiol ring-cleavage dioxygenase n=1 Tax=Streptomyces sp. CRN 30 TaxID=3075613 RepID=UPI002A81C620|nr:intradiol ring-cleavage dioxygenase [Streptomyces sp. CRN 30]
MTDNTDPHIRRRTVLLGTGATAAALTVGATAASDLIGDKEPTGLDRAEPVAAAAVCTLTKELTEGPYYLDGALVRADITEDKPGIPLDLVLTVVDDGTCAPIGDALVELWHSDALGEYSGFVGNNGHQEPDNGTFLRGGTLTGSDGVVRISTIYPGWYRGRAIHIHVKVHTDVTLTSNGSFSGGQELHTGQLFIAESITTAVARVSPYSTNTVPRTSLAQDGIYGNGGAAAGLMTVTGSTTAGYTGSLTLGIDQG